MTARLTASDKDAIGDASPEGLLKHAEWVGRYVTHSRFLGVDNAYREDVVRRLRTDSQGQTTPNTKHLGEYIAASPPLHLWDGWGYFGQALLAQVRGHRDIAIHLAYYAELRAAMSLLATQGIGVFDRQHFMIDRSGLIHTLRPNPTHVATWLYLKEWGQSAQAGALVGTVLKPQSIAIRDWVDSLPIGVAWRPVGTDLLLRLGLDLERMADDRRARNEVSYRPTSLRTSGRLPPTEEARYLAEVIRTLEPAGAGAFNVLDMYLLRETVGAAFKSATNSTPRQAPVRFRSAVATMLEAVVPNSVTRAQLDQFLSGSGLPSELTLVLESSRQDTVSHPRHHVQVLSRAALLLRVATGAVREMLLASSLHLDAISFWWAEVGYSQGLWQFAPEVVDLPDLWLDLAQAAEDITEWCNNGDGTLHGLVGDCARSLHDATSFGAVALLGLAS